MTQRKYAGDSSKLHGDLNFTFLTNEKAKSIITRQLLHLKREPGCLFKIR
jgi:hypothetical protein